MATKNRTDLKSYFVKNAIPTEGNFADLIDSQLNQAQDGVFKLEGEPLSVVAASGDQKRVLRLYANYPSANPDWLIALNPLQDGSNASSAKSGLGITDGAGTARLFVQAGTGRVGIGTNTPQSPLEVVGEVRANGVRGRNDLALNDYRTVNPTSNVCLHSPGNDRDAWIYRDAADTNTNWGLYHRQIDSAIAGLPANSIGFIGGGSSKLQAYVSLGDGSASFAGGLTVGGALSVTGAVSASAGVIVDGKVDHIDRDGALYRNTDGQVYLTVDDNLYIRDRGASGVAAHFNTDNGALKLTGKLATNGYDPELGTSHGWSGGVVTWDIIVNANGFAHGAWKASAFDLAERFANHEEGLEPGDVLAVDPRAPERLVRSRSAQQDDLVGVVSERPGFVLGVPWEDPDAGIPLALAGRVPVKVNLEGGPVRIGDYLTSSSTPGVAMRTIRPGRVIGLAMQAFDGTAGPEGKVVVLVNPHWFGGR